MGHLIQILPNIQHTLRRYQRKIQLRCHQEFRFYQEHLLFVQLTSLTLVSSFLLDPFLIYEEMLLRNILAHGLRPACKREKMDFQILNEHR